VTSLSLRPAAAPEVSLSALRDLLPAAQLQPGSSADQAPQIRGVTLDSRQVRPGDLYAALPGAHFHGARFAAEAAAAGAVAVFTDPAGAEEIVAEGPPASELALLFIPAPRERLGQLASAVYGHPTSQLSLLGVTGTNGKTTVSYLLDAGLRAAGHRTGLIGTVATRIGDEVQASVRTTPEAPELQALFATMRERGVDAATMEVSSHALALHRVDGCRFTGGAFTNLSQDHLDFHPTLEDYFQAKAMLFDPEAGFLPRTARAVVAADDPYGQRLAASRPDAVTYGLAAGADWSAAELRCDPAGSEFTVIAPRGLGSVRARVQLAGLFNVSNALCAIALLTETGTPLAAAIEGVAALPGVPGRMERVDAGQPFLALVDYAHTPAAVSGLLATVRELVTGRVLLVLGCGGDRDRGKRPMMGAAAVRGADLAILTSDNPRSEDPLAILAEMQAGAEQASAAGAVGAFVVEPDRGVAIARAVSEARPGDALVVAGKGHESGQDIGGVIHVFDDRDVLVQALAGLSAAG
jgi:UDP-N-acetylmuramoyl-L-alanyl-D-glutamate--2,6-diaminopimelate ligase